MTNIILLTVLLVVACAMEVMGKDAIKSGTLCRNSCIQSCMWKPSSCRQECYKAKGCGKWAKRAYYGDRQCGECYERCAKLGEGQRNGCKEDCMIEKGCYPKNYRVSCQHDCWTRSKGCQCDLSCKHHGTCCADYDQYCAAKHQRWWKF